MKGSKISGFIKRANQSIEMSNMLSKFGLKRKDDVSFSDASFWGKSKDFIFCIVGGEMAIFGYRFPIINGGIVALLYGYQFLLCIVEEIANQLSSMENSTAQSIGNELASNSLLIFGSVFILGLIIACVAISLFKFFMRAFIFISTLLVFTVGPGRGLFSQFGIVNPLPALILGIIASIFMMIYLEKVLRKAVLVLLFSVVGNALVFVGVEEILDIDGSVGKAILGGSTPSGPSINIFKDFFLFWVSVAVSCLIQIFIT
ncbi:uncharacterized protein NEMAJ01_1426 [Nematocida major]|uniref:uncharacterized protein n=1 Tax=Nematocida major TaxID=1912982 RepID=UPI0020088F48|nr:uncharacterized protein NEMAJ01_1426 [Nematocida major]KAH9386530.1 hypothetical protein NEMAJ01_1426 [Nematocida major]